MGRSGSTQDCPANDDDAKTGVHTEPEPMQDIRKLIQLYRPPLWSSGQSSWLQVRRPGFDSRHYQIFWKKRKKENSSGSGTGCTQPREYN
jgi:hypothetical protein